MQSLSSEKFFVLCANDIWEDLWSNKSENISFCVPSLESLATCMDLLSEHVCEQHKWWVTMEIKHGTRTIPWNVEPTTQQHQPSLQLCNAFKDPYKPSNLIHLDIYLYQSTCINLSMTIGQISFHNLFSHTFFLL